MSQKLCQYHQKKLPRRIWQSRSFNHEPLKQEKKNNNKKQNFLAFLLAENKYVSETADIFTKFKKINQNKFFCKTSA